jgi:hypothetical protein
LQSPLISEAIPTKKKAEQTKNAANNLDFSKVFDKTNKDITKIVDTKGHEKIFSLT